MDGGITAAICIFGIGGILTLIFIVSTLSRLTEQRDLIGKLRKDLLDLRNEIRGIQDREESRTETSPEVEKSEMAERFDEVKEAARKATASQVDPPPPEEEPPPVTPPPLPSMQSTSDRAGIKLTPDPVPVVQEFNMATVPKPTSQPASAPEPAGPSRLQSFLEKINLWPPSGDTAAEATIGAWWATRIGLIVAIIGATFGGIYVAEGAPPWTRVLAMTVISIAVTILGLRLERKIPAFGRLISAGGLGLGYFTAFAAFALAPMKIIDSSTIGLLAQAAILVVMVGWSLWKRDEVVAGMAILLGYVSCWFSLENDQMDFVVTGLMMLAAAASFLLWKRQWLWSQGIAILGTWIGFLALGIFEWDSETAPAFLIVLGGLLGAQLIFEAGHFFAGNKFEVKTLAAKWLRRLSVLSSPLSIFVGYFVIAETYPEQKAVFYLSFAVMMLLFSLAHFFRKHEISRGLDQMFFLKMSALLCLFFVAQFDGPVRWLAIALQAGAVLFTWRRTGYRWVEVAFGILFFVAGAALIRGVITYDADLWSLFSPQNLVSLLSLTALSFWLTIYRHWKFPIDGDQPKIDSQENPLYLLGAVTIAVAAWFVASVPLDVADAFRPVFLIIAAGAVALPLLRWAKAGPVLAATLILIGAFAKILLYSGEMITSKATTLGFVGAGIAIVLAELCRRGWRPDWILGNVFRTVYAGFGSLLLLSAMNLLTEQFDGISVICLLVFAGIGMLLLAQNALGLRAGVETKSPELHVECQWVLSILIGLVAVIFCPDVVKGEALAFNSVWFALAGAILLAATFFTRSAVPIIAGGLPLVASVISFLGDYDKGGSTNEILIAAGGLLVIFVGIIVVLHRFTGGKKSDFLAGCETILIGAAALILHWALRPFLDASEILAADCGIMLGLVLAARRWPMRTLKASSAWPIGFAVLHVGLLAFDLYEEGPEALWWVAAVLVLAWGWIYYQGDAIRLPDFSAAAPDRKIVFGWPTILVTAVFWLVAIFGSNEPWQSVSFAAFAIVVLVFWRFANGAGGHLWTWILVASALVTAARSIVHPDGFEAETLAVVIVTAGLVVIHGVLYPREIEEFRNLSIFHALPALGLVFWACSPDVLTVDKLTTVCWGAASVVLFVMGLMAGLKIYRIVGLVGLGLCIFRMFLVDIDDTLYRIIAFLGVAIVLLIIGFLYHRFRGRIENQFSGKTD